MRRLGANFQDLVLLGAGHAHVEVLRRLAMRPEPQLRLTLVSREPATPYSGMLPGLIRGEYAFEQTHIDLAPLAAAAGARLLIAEAFSLDLDERHVAVAGRPPIPFDLISVNVGGEPRRPEGPGIPVKPIGRFLGRLEALQASLPAGSRVAIIGAGPAGAELTLALARRFGGLYHLTLVGREGEPLPDAPPRARGIVRAALVDADVELVSGVSAGRYEGGRLALSDGSFLDADEALWTTDVAAPRFLAESGLACDEAGCIRVDATLRSVSHHFAFAAGDCAALDETPRPKAGVWAVRAGGPLAQNLRRAAHGRRLQTWKPQREALTLLCLGDGRAVGWRNGVTVAGEWVARWKDRVDRRWMAMYQRLRPMASDPEAPMRCGGCGAKIGAETLAEVLDTLPLTPSPDVLIGLQTPDDAAVLRPPAGLAIVQSVDHFRAFIDDPFVFGEIAAAHALSDLHAMGARPWTALAIATMPHQPARKTHDDLTAMMQGAAATLQSDGCALVGGHSAEGAEAALGFAVTGLVETTRIMRKSGLRAGDALLLTKPLGVGVILAAHALGRCKAVWLADALAVMRRTNAEASRILSEHGVRSCTDVSGFGLVGHLMEMLTASGVSARLAREAIPVLAGARQLAGDGVASTLAPENMRLLRTAAGEATRRDALLVDPQTSGGLLAGVAAERATACLHALRGAGLEAASIGRVTPFDGVGPRLSLTETSSGSETREIAESRAQKLAIVTSF